MPDPSQDPPPSPAPAPAPAPSPATAKPAWLPDAFWDGQAGGFKPDFEQHYGELAAAHKTLTEQRASVPTKPEDYKFEAPKLPDDVKVPDGFTIKVDAKDPRIPLLRAIAHEHGWPQAALDKLLALDARLKIEAHNAEMARVAAETKKLGDNAKQRTDAILAWASALKDDHKLTDDEMGEIRFTAGTAAGVSLLEKLIAKANGNVPGYERQPPPPPPPKTLEERIWPGGFAKVPQARTN